MQSSIRKLSAMFQKILSKSQRSQQRNVASDGATGFFPRMPSKNLWKSKENNQLSSLEDEVAANAMNSQARAFSNESIEQQSDSSLENNALTCSNESIEQQSDPSLENDTLHVACSSESIGDPSLENDTLARSSETIEQQSDSSIENNTLAFYNESIEQQSENSTPEDTFLQDECEDAMSRKIVTLESSLVMHWRSALSLVDRPPVMLLNWTFSSLSTVSFTTASFESFECSQDKTSISDNFSFSSDSSSLSYLTESSESDYDSSLWYSNTEDYSSCSQESVNSQNSSTGQDSVTCQNNWTG